MKTCANPDCGKEIDNSVFPNKLFCDPACAKRSYFLRHRELCLAQKTASRHAKRYVDTFAPARKRIVDDAPWSVRRERIRAKYGVKLPEPTRISGVDIV